MNGRAPSRREGQVCLSVDDDMDDAMLKTGMKSASSIASRTAPSGLIFTIRVRYIRKAI